MPLWCSGVATGTPTARAGATATPMSASARTRWARARSRRMAGKLMTLRAPAMLSAENSDVAATLCLRGEAEAVRTAAASASSPAYRAWQAEPDARHPPMPPCIIAMLRQHGQPPAAR